MKNGSDNDFRYNGEAWGEAKKKANRGSLAVRTLWSDNSLHPDLYVHSTDWSSAKLLKTDSVSGVAEFADGETKEIAILKPFSKSGFVTGDAGNLFETGRLTCEEKCIDSR